MQTHRGGCDAGRMVTAGTETQSRGIAAYRNVFFAPRVRPLLLVTLLARLPISMGAVGLILFVHGETGSFGSAGIVTGAFTIGIGVTGPMLAGVLGRRGSGAGR